MNDELKKMKKTYEQIPIPEALDDVVEQALRQKVKHRPKWLLHAAAAVAIVTTSVNMSPTLARSLAQIPAVGAIVEVLTFTEYEVEEEQYEAHITVPTLTDDSPDIQAVNEQFRRDGEALYAQFQQEIEAIGEGYYAVNSGYSIYTNTARLLSMSRYVEEIAASSASEETFITVDKQLKTVITLRSLFTDERYIAVISDEIIAQMRRNIESDKEAVYWIDAFAQDLPQEERFTMIDAFEQFYINEQQQLVIVFNEYDVAPGSMGRVEFIIPTERIATLLANDLYIK